MKNWRSSTSFHPKKRIVKSNADGLLLAKFLNNADENSGVSHISDSFLMNRYMLKVFAKQQLLWNSDQGNS